MNNSSKKVSVFAYLWRLMRGYKFYLILIIQAPLIGGFLIPAEQYIIKMIVDLLVSLRNIGIYNLLLPICLFILVQIFLDIIWRISQYGEYKSIPHIRSKLTQTVYSQVIEYGYPFFQSNLSGSTSSKINSIESEAMKIFDNLKLHIIHPVSMIFTTLFFLYAVSPFFVLAIIIFYSILFPCVYFLSKKIHYMSEDYSVRKQGIVGMIHDSISNIASVFLFSNKEKEKRSIKSNLRKLILSEKRIIRQEFLLHLVVGVLYISVSSGVLFLLIYLRQHGRITIGDFVLVLSLMGHMLQIAYILVMNLKVLVRDIGSLKASFSILNEEHDQHIQAALGSMNFQKPSIEFRNVSFSYDDVSIFKKFNLYVHPGEKLGIVGHSGAGKSTLINILLRYFDINEGQILIGEQDISSSSRDSVREAITVIPQNTNLFHRTLKENIAYGNLSATFDEVVSACKKAQLHDFIDRLPMKYNTVVGENGLKLSGGQRQRVAIARAILKNSPILVLDEATSSLDSVTEKQIQECLDSLVNEKRKTVVAIAHRLSTLKNMDRIIVLEDGEIVEQGTHASLLQSSTGIYRRLWDFQATAV